MKLRATRRASLALLLVIAACSGVERGDGPDPTSRPSTSSTSMPSTSSAPASTAPSSTDTAPSSTAIGPPPLTLRPDGLGQFDFGTDAAPALAAATTVFGMPDRDDTTVYQRTDTAGLWMNASTGFAHEFSRTTCWTDVLCVYFGGTSLDELQFVGWWYYDTAGAGAVPLSTADRIGIGSILGEHLDSISILDNTACYSEVTGSTPDGLDVSMKSVGEPFFSYDATGLLVEGHPPTADVVVVGLAARDRESEQDADC